MAGYGGARPNSGGRRNGAGRKLDPTVQEFVRRWRKRLLTKEWDKHLAKRAKNSDQVLCRLLDKLVPTPLAVSGDIGGAPVYLSLGDNLGVKL